VTIVAVIGDGSCSAATARLAEETGRLLAEKGAAVVCGGLGGVMEATCRGAKSAGGLTIGILPGRRRQDANRYIDIPIVTGMGEARNVIVVSSAQSVIAIRGGYGTLSEIAHALRQGIPVVGLGSWRLSRDGWDSSGAIHHSSDPADAVQKALALAIE
jgi:uncharacterized protein (TIGR00725 family)